MLVKSYPFDTPYFHILFFPRTSTDRAVSKKYDCIKRDRGQVFQISKGSIKCGGKEDAVYTHELNRHPDVENTCLKRFKDDRRNEGKIHGSVKARREKAYVSERILPAKCLTKWANRRGCLPAVLQALKTVEEVDEALKPWEEEISNKAVSAILKEQSSWKRAMEVFEWFKKKGCYDLNVIHHNILLRILGKAHQWREVEILWDEMKTKGIVPVNSTYGTLIDVYCKGGRRKEAFGWLDLMNRQGIEPDEVTMGIVVQLYKKAGEYKKAEEFFMKWSCRKSSITEEKTSKGMNSNAEGARFPLSLYTYNSLIDIYGKAGKLQEASSTFARMIAEGIVPDIVTFNTMIHIYGNNGRLEEVASLMQKMEELRCPMDMRTYSILISLHSKHNNLELAVSYFTKMKEARLEPDLVSYQTLLDAFSIRRMVSDAEKLVTEMEERGLKIDGFTQSSLTRMYIQAGMLEKSWLWFQRFHTKGNMNSDFYSANIDAYGEHGHVSEAEKAFLCSQEGRKTSVLECNVMIKAYGINKRYDEACRLFDSMETRGVIPDKCSYNTLIQILASAELPEAAKGYARKMQKAGLIGDCIPYCAVISSFAKSGLPKMAEEFFEEMIGYGVKPDVMAYGILINAFADAGSVEEAGFYLDAMRSSGLRANDIICNSLIKLYTKVGFLEEAQKTYKLLQSSERGPIVYSSNCMIDLYSERFMVKQAEEVFEYLRRKGEANEFSFAMMLCMYKKIGSFREAVAIALEMKARGLLTELLSYNNVLALYALDGKLEEAVEMFEEMINAGVQPDNFTFKSLGVVLVKSGFSKEAVGKLELAREKNGLRGLQEWRSALSSVVGSNEW